MLQYKFHLCHCPLTLHSQIYLAANVHFFNGNKILANSPFQISIKSVLVFCRSIMFYIVIILLHVNTHWHYHYIKTWILHLKQMSITACYRDNNHFLPSGKFGFRLYGKVHGWVTFPSGHILQSKVLRQVWMTNDLRTRNVKKIV
jgi:hypothetical protein